MRHSRPFVALAAAVLLTWSASAQEAAAEPRRVETPLGTAGLVHDHSEVADAKFTLWVTYANNDDDFLDHSQYLDDLQSRWQAKGVAIGVLMPIGDAKEVAAGKPRYLVAAPDKDDAAANKRLTPTVHAYLCRGTADDLISSWRTLDGIPDLLSDQVDGQASLQADRIQQQLQSLINSVCDGGEFGQMAQECLQALPHSGRAHAGMVLYHWWCQGDLVAARKAIDRGIKALSGDSVAITVFTDMVLRGDRSDPEIARTLAVAMAPAAAIASDGVFTQLVYLRALLHAGQDRMAGRIAAILPKRLRGRAKDQLIFAETLMEAATPQVHRDLAERALAAAGASKQLERWRFCARHKILSRCGDDEAATRLMQKYRKSNGGRGDLNNDAWYLIVQLPTMGRFDTLAFAQATRLEKSSGNNLSFGNKDTVALAYFRNGHYEKAVELQTEATKASNQNPVYVARLKRFEATLEAQKVTKDERAAKDK